MFGKAVGSRLVGKRDIAGVWFLGDEF